jgi:hypothetical protein
MCREKILRFSLAFPFFSYLSILPFQVTEVTPRSARLPPPPTALRPPHGRIAPAVVTVVTSPPGSFAVALGALPSTCKRVGFLPPKTAHQRVFISAVGENNELCFRRTVAWQMSSSGV